MCSDLEDLCDCCTCIPRGSRWIVCPVSVVVGIGLFLMTVLLPLSLQKVAFDEVAISYDKVSRELGTSVLGEGLHVLQPSETLLILKRTQRNVGINHMHALTNDGLTVDVDIEVYYSIDTTKTAQILALYNDQEYHDQYIADLSKQVCRDVISEFTARSFFLQRQEVQDGMEKLLKTKFVSGDAFATVEAVQLNNVDFEPAVATALELSTIVQQDIQNAQAEKATDENRATIRKEIAALDAALSLLRADRDVKIRKLQAEADAAGITATMLWRSFAFGNVSQAFGKTSDFFVHSYLSALVLRLNSGRTVVGLD